MSQCRQTDRQTDMVSVADSVTGDALLTSGSKHSLNVGDEFLVVVLVVDRRRLETHRLQSVLILHMPPTHSIQIYTDTHYTQTD